ncbi:hypothetical protein ACHQM5_028508 [Ranunculus cassubicifolius]
MDRIEAAEEQIISQRMRRKLNDLNVTAEAQLAPITDHVNFTLQQEYFKCAYECFDRQRKQEEINNCVEHCSAPVMRANNVVQEEMSRFQERLNRSMMVCQDKFEAARLQKRTGAMVELESCVDHAIQDGTQNLPHIVNHLKAKLMIREENN